MWEDSPTMPLYRIYKSVEALAYKYNVFLNLLSFCNVFIARKESNKNTSIESVCAASVSVYIINIIIAFRSRSLWKYTLYNILPLYSMIFSFMQGDSLIELPAPRCDSCWGEIFWNEKFCNQTSISNFLTFKTTEA